MTPSVSKVPTLNGQMGPPGRPQMSQAPMARHPSREQLIDYLMLKVSQQPQGPPRIPQDTVQQEVVVHVSQSINTQIDDVWFLFLFTGFAQGS